MTLCKPHPQYRSRNVDSAIGGKGAARSNRFDLRQKPPEYHQATIPGTSQAADAPRRHQLQIAKHPAISAKAASGYASAAGISGADLVMFGQTFGMIPQHLKHLAIGSTSTAAFVNHAFQFGAQRLQTGHALLHLL